MLSNEGAALGAAILAGVAAGIYSSVGEGCEMAVKENMTLQYCKESHEEYMKYYSIYKELYSNIKDSFKQLKNI